MKRLFGPLVFLFCLSLHLSVMAGTFTWDGSHDGNWTRKQNWTPKELPDSGFDDLIFAGTSQVINYMNADWTVNSIAFSNSAGSFTLNGAGNLLTLGGGGVSHADNSLQTIAASTIMLSADQTWQTSSTGSLSVSSQIVNGGNMLSLSPASGTTITLSGALSGTGGLIKSSSGTLVLSGPSRALKKPLFSET